MRSVLGRYFQVAMQLARQQGYEFQTQCFGFINVNRIWYSRTVIRTLKLILSGSGLIELDIDDRSIIVFTAEFQIIGEYFGEEDTERNCGLYVEGDIVCIHIDDCTFRHAIAELQLINN